MLKTNLVKTAALAISLFLTLGLAYFFLADRHTLSNDFTLGLSEAGFKKSAQLRFKINQTEISVELPATSQQREQGLSGRLNLAENEGMLFIFDNKARHSFWMKGMNFPLDFIWIEDDRVVDITENVPAPSGLTDLLKIYQPNNAVNQVLEVNAGFVQNSAIRIGDRVYLTNI